MILSSTYALYVVINNDIGDSTVGKSALTQAFASDGTHIPKAYTMVSLIAFSCVVLGI